MNLSIIIVNYNVKDYLRQCLYSVERAVVGMQAEVVVLDNASTDGSVEELAPLFPEVRFVSCGENLGFSRANNEGIRMTTGEYVLLLNPDTILGEEVLKLCVSFMDSHAEAGAVGVRMLKENGAFAYESRRGVPTMFTSFCKMVGLCSLFPKSRLFGRYYMRYLDPNEINRIDIVSGAFMMVRRSALDEVGLLDETFFMYGEDIDLSYRLLKAGYSNYYIPRSILHYKGESTQRTSFRYVHNFYSAMLIFYKKHFRSNGWLLMQLIRLAVCLMGGLNYLFLQRKKLPLQSERGGYKMLMVGTRDACDEVERMAEGMEDSSCYCLSLEQHEEEERNLPLGRIATCREEGKMEFTHIVFDIDNFNFADILAFMRRENRRKGLKRMKLGTYSSASRTLVFASGVCHYES